MHHGVLQYQRSGERAASPRAIEIAVLRETNRRMTEASTEEARIGALHRNHTMWSVLIKDVGLTSNPLPAILKKDLTDIGLFAMQFSTVAIMQRLPVDSLVEINEQIINGLVAQAPEPAPQFYAHQTGRGVSATSA